MPLRALPFFRRRKDSVSASPPSLPRGLRASNRPADAAPRTTPGQSSEAVAPKMFLVKAAPRLAAGNSLHPKLWPSVSMAEEQLSSREPRIEILLNLFPGPELGSAGVNLLDTLDDLLLPGAFHLFAGLGFDTLQNASRHRQPLQPR